MKLSNYHRHKRDNHLLFLHHGLVLLSDCPPPHSLHFTSCSSLSSLSSSNILKLNVNYNMPTHIGAEHLWREIRPPKRQDRCGEKGGVARMRNPIDWLWPLTEENNQNLMAASLRWAKAVNFITNSYSYYLSLCCDCVPDVCVISFWIDTWTDCGEATHSSRVLKLTPTSRRSKERLGSPRFSAGSTAAATWAGHQHRPSRHAAAIQPHRLSIRSRRDPQSNTAEELPGSHGQQLLTDELHLRTGWRKCQGMSSAQGDHTPGTRPPSYRPTHTL